MDCFDRFTLLSNQHLVESFDEIENSYNLGILKTSNNGQYFYEKAKSLNVDLKNCIVIDDSEKVCKTFENLGGKGICSFGILEVVKNLEKLLKKVLYYKRYQ